MDFFFDFSVFFRQTLYKSAGNNTNGFETICWISRPKGDYLIDAVFLDVKKAIPTRGPPFIGRYQLIADSFARDDYFITLTALVVPSV